MVDRMSNELSYQQEGLDQQRAQEENSRTSTVSANDVKRVLECQRLAREYQMYWMAGTATISIYDISKGEEEFVVTVSTLEELEYELRNHIKNRGT